MLQSAVLARSGQVYVLDMGEPVKIVELARDLIRLSGQDENDIGIVFSGLRPGEKLFEELLADSDLTQPSAHPRLRIARLNDDATETWTRELLDWLGGRGGEVSPATQRERLAQFIPEYKPKKVVDRRALSAESPATSAP